MEELLLHLEVGIWCKVLKYIVELCPVCLLKLNCWHIGWVVVSSIVDVLNSKQMTSWSDPVVASSSRAQLVIDSVDVSAAKVRSRMEVPVSFL